MSGGNTPQLLVSSAVINKSSVHEGNATGHVTLVFDTTDNTDNLNTVVAQWSHGLRG